jgi:hypothetical protein
MMAGMTMVESGTPVVITPGALLPIITAVAPHDPEAKLYRKAQSAPAKLHYLGHVLMEHRTGLPVDVEVFESLRERRQVRSWWGLQRRRSAETERARRPALGTCKKPGSLY